MKAIYINGKFIGWRTNADIEDLPWWVPLVAVLSLLIAVVVPWL